MNSFESWVSTQKFDKWLIAGSDPTISRLGEFDLTGYGVIAIGDAANKCNPTAVAFMDAHSPELLSQLPEGADTIVLDSLSGSVDDDGAVAVKTSTYKHGNTTKQAALHLFEALAASGICNIRTIGIDGNFCEVAPIIQKYDLFAGPLTSEVPGRIYIGTDITQLLGARMLEYSVRKYSSLTVEFDNMMHVQYDWPKDPKNQPRTNFSFNRFEIPRLAGYRGRGVYVDADMQVFNDFKEMWDLDFQGGTVLHAPSNDPKRPRQFSVLLLDCGTLKWDIREIVRGLDEGKYDYAGLMREMCIEPQENIKPLLPSDWNSLEEYIPSKTRLIHYTDMPTQPWVSSKNKNGHVFVNALRDAINEGFISIEDIKEGIKSGYARPSLLTELESPEAGAGFAGKIRLFRTDFGFKPHKMLVTRLAGGR